MTRKMNKLRILRRNFPTFPPFFKRSNTSEPDWQESEITVFSLIVLPQQSHRSLTFPVFDAIGSNEGIRFCNILEQNMSYYSDNRQIVFGLFFQRWASLQNLPSTNPHFPFR
jgi:hypothetical protein